MLPPVQFPPATTTEFTVGLTDTEWLKVFSSLMAGADLLYPDESHEVVWAFLRNVEYPLPALGYGYQTRFTLFPRSAIILAGNTMAFANVTAAFFAGYWQQNVAAINDKHYYICWMGEGHYTLNVYYRKSAVSGIATFKAEPSPGSPITIGTVDFYNATTTENNLASINFVIPATDKYLITVSALTHNAAALTPFYALSYSMIELLRWS